MLSGCEIMAKKNDWTLDYAGDIMKNLGFWNPKRFDERVKWFRKEGFEVRVEKAYASGKLRPSKLYYREK